MQRDAIRATTDNEPGDIVVLVCADCYGTTCHIGDISKNLPRSVALGGARRRRHLWVDYRAVSGSVNT
jgi:hypothetical protein